MNFVVNLSTRVWSCLYIFKIRTASVSLTATLLLMSSFGLDKIASDILQEVVSYATTEERHVIKLVNLHFRKCVRRQMVKEIRSSITRGLQICIRLPREYLDRFQNIRCRIVTISKLDWPSNRMQIHSHCDTDGTRTPLVLWCHITDDFGILWTWEPPHWVTGLCIDWYVYVIFMAV